MPTMINTGMAVKTRCIMVPIIAPNIKFTPYQVTTDRVKRRTMEIINSSSPNFFFIVIFLPVIYIMVILFSPMRQYMFGSIDFFNYNKYDIPGKEFIKNYKMKII